MGDGSARADVEALAARIGCAVSVFTAVSADEMASVLSATAPGVDREGNLAQRIPIVPPIGDTYLFDRPADEQERWIAKLDSTLSASTAISHRSYRPKASPPTPRCAKRQGNTRQVG